MVLVQDKRTNELVLKQLSESVCDKGLFYNCWHGSKKSNLTFMSENDLRIVGRARVCRRGQRVLRDIGRSKSGWEAEDLLGKLWEREGAAC